ncbi:MAG TPA: hypothetical protein VLQ45_12675 [Thermoanaerobaculia bacterium]|nr:hypothetical protein [Thermoanaerobaculia bacterium]
MRERFLMPVLIVLLSVAPPLEGEEPSLASLSFLQEAALTVPTLKSSSQFGWSAALSGDGNTALIGAIGEEACPNDPQATCRAAYVFVRAGGVWSLEARLPGGGFEFGDEVALSADGNVALVHDRSLPCPSSGGLNCGGVVVFVRSGGGWVPETTILSPTFADFEYGAFGSSLALSADGSIALIGKNAENCVLQPCLGAVYVFTRGAGGVWTQEAHIVPSEPDVNFGIAVALSGDGSIALFGSPLTDCAAAGESCGAVFAFSRSGGAWSPQQKLTASDPVFRGAFGSSVALSADGNVALIGAPNIELFGTEAGSVFIFNREGGVWTEKREIPLGEPGEGVGRAVSLSGDGGTLLAGGPAASCAEGVECGEALWSVFRAGIWTSPQPLTQFGANDLGGFALALSADGRTALVTAPRGPCADGTSSCGIAYVFTLAPLGLEIPALDGLGLTLLAILLAASGAALLARRRRSA